jgi:cytochrome c peroxidase
MALITGRCADIGRKSVPQIRALASRAPYFSDGSAATLRDVVEFYNKRFAIKFTEQQKQDLVSFMEAL